VPACAAWATEGRRETRVAVIENTVLLAIALLGGGRAAVTGPIDDWTGALRMLAGILLVVQGFETSRYLGAAYDAETRIRTMRHAQIISGTIYIVFVALASPLLAAFHGTRDETAIISMSAQVAAVPGRSHRQHQSHPPETRSPVAFLSRAHGPGAVAGGAVRDPRCLINSPNPFCPRSSIFSTWATG
jgi:hypothetical protein